MDKARKVNRPNPPTMKAMEAYTKRLFGHGYQLIPLIPRFKLSSSRRKVHQRELIRLRKIQAFVREQWLADMRTRGTRRRSRMWQTILGLLEARIEHLSVLLMISDTKSGIAP